MTVQPSELPSHITDRYTIERELGRSLTCSRASLPACR